MAYVNGNNTAIQPCSAATCTGNVVVLVVVAVAVRFLRGSYDLFYLLVSYSSMHLIYSIVVVHTNCC